LHRKSKSNANLDDIRERNKLEELALKADEESLERERERIRLRLESLYGKFS
jgi:hypothetical protein